jgi:6-phosphogluconolactonase
MNLRPDIRIFADRRALATPGHPALKEARRWVVPVFNAPKPPPVRVTLTLPVINSARQVVFVASGSGKTGLVADVLRPAAGRPNLPARMVKPTDGEPHWFVDHDAAGVRNSSILRP